MKKLCAALIGLLLASAAQAQSVSWPPPAGTIAFLCVYTTVPPTLVTTNVGFVQCDNSGRILTANTPSGTQDVNVAKINGITPLMGNGVTGTGSPRVTIASDNTAFSVNATLGAETTKVIGTVNQGTSPWVVSGTFFQATQPVSIAAAPLQPLALAPTDRTITSASGASQQIMAANAARHLAMIENTGNANCGINPTGGTAVIGGAGTFTLAPLGGREFQTLSAVNVICTAGQPIYAEEN